KTSGGKVANCFSTSASARWSGYSGICSAGFWRQLSGVHRSAITRPSHTLTRGAGKDIRGGLYTTAGAPSQPSRLFGRLPHVGHGLLAHGHEFLGGGRMHGHHGVEIGLGRLHLHRDADELDHLAGVRPDEVTADHAIGRAVDDELHEG